MLTCDSNPYRGLQAAISLGVALFLGFCISARALDPSKSVFQYNCQTWQRVNGLPVNSVNAIAQTADGRLWLGTSKGLIYFNGADFRIIGSGNRRDANSDAVVTTLVRHGKEGLWYGLDRGGFGLFDGKDFHPIEMTNRPELQSAVHQIIEGSDGSMLLAAEIAAGRLTGTNYDSLEPLPRNDVFSVFEDKRGRIWIGTADQGLFYWERGKLVPFPDQTLRGSIVSSITIDSSGKLWIGMAHGITGLKCYDETFKPVPIPNVDILPEAKALFVDRHGVLWIGTSGEGLARYQNGKLSFFKKQDGLASNRILTIAESDNGSLWVGTVDGLTELSDVKFPILSQTEGLPTEACFGVAPAQDGSIWAATPDGISHYDNKQFFNYGTNSANGFHARWMKRVFAARNGDVYVIGAKKNLDRFSGDHVVNTWTNGLWPRAVAEDSSGIIVAFGGELMRLQDDKLIPLRLANGGTVSVGWVENLLIARDGSLWIASSDGVFQIKNNVLHNQTQGISGNPRAYYLCEDDSGAMWAAQSGRLLRLKNGTCKKITKNEGLPDASVCAIVADNFGCFWMDSYRGLFRVKQNLLNAVADGLAPKITCDLYDGLDSVKTTDKMEQNYSGCRSLDGRIWFPCSKGIIVIDPAHIPRDTTPPTVFIEQMRVNGRQYAVDSTPALDPGPGNLEFGYSALDYAAPQKVQYRYRLQGYQTDWVNAGARRSAFYTNIKPGHYQFQVQACNSDGIWNTTGASIGLQLPESLYENPFFLTASGMLILGLGIYLWWTWHLRQKQVQLEKTNALMETRIGERTTELARTNAKLVNEIEQRKLAQAKTDELQEQLIRASRQAGQAEVASSVLHNVGNVLNSVNVSTTLIHDHLNSLPLHKLSKAADLAENDTAASNGGTADEKRKMLGIYLRQFSNFLTGERERLVMELKDLARNIEHINEIVAMQQGYARISGINEITVAEDLVETAMRMHANAFSRHGIAVMRQYEAVPQITVDKHKVLQILVNIIQNAKHACNGVHDAQVTVRIQLVADNRISISIADNGVGIAKENLTKIFSHGFTTRKDGHGFGLHSSALAARELGGKLSAASDGPGLGATFTLEIPTTPPM